jgi:hypothetical protein
MKGQKLWKIVCSVCKKEFLWKYPKPVIATGITNLSKEELKRIGFTDSEAEKAVSDETYMNELLLERGSPIAFSYRCPNRLGEDQQAPECGTMWQIVTDPEKIAAGSEDGIRSIRMSPTPESDRFWTEMALKRVDQTLDSLDKRAEFMLTTIAALIAINFGILHAFDIPFFSVNVAPQFLLATSAIFFVLSHFPKVKVFFAESPDDVKEKYTEGVTDRYKWHSWGYSLFVLGLFAVGITYLIQPLGNPPGNVQNINVTLTINLSN